MKLPDYTAINRIHFRHTPKGAVTLNGSTPKEEAASGAAAYGLGSILGSLATISLLNRGKRQEAEVIVVEKTPVATEKQGLPNWAKLAVLGVAVGAVTLFWMRRRRSHQTETPASGWAPSEEESGEGIISIRAVQPDPMPDVPADQPLVSVPPENNSDVSGQNPSI